MGISFGLGGQASLSHVLGSGLWALEDPVSMVCSVAVLLGASQCYYLGVVDSHLLLRQSSLKCCNTALTQVNPGVTDFTQV